MSAAPIHHKWQHITDIPADLEQFRDRELESLYQVWLDQRSTVDEKAFAAELAREWSIETGIIEGVYTLDRGTTEILIRRGIDSSYISRGSTNQDPELVAKTISAHADVLEGLFDFVAARRELSTSYVKELHAALLRHQHTVKGVDQFGTEVFAELKRGAYKEHANSPTRRDKAVHEYCPPEQVASEMDRLVAFHKKHEERNVVPLVEAAWLHHAFTQIHPFQDGNGRVARALASLILIKDGFFPLVVNRDDWEKYIDALEAADQGDLAAFVDLFARLQKRDLTKAIVHAAEARPVETVNDAIAVTRDVLAAVAKLSANARVEVESRAFQLRDLTTSRLTETAARLEKQVGALAFRFFPGPDGMQGTTNATLAIKGGGNIYTIVVEFGMGSPALIGAEFRKSISPPIPLADDVFRIDHSEPLDELLRRFTKWLDNVIIRGLAEWRKTLV